MKLMFVNSKKSSDWWIAEGDSPRVGEFLREETPGGTYFFKVKHVEHVYRGARGSPNHQFSHCEILVSSVGKVE